MNDEGGVERRTRNGIWVLVADDDDDENEMSEVEWDEIGWIGICNR